VEVAGLIDQYLIIIYDKHYVHLKMMLARMHTNQCSAGGATDVAFSAPRIQNLEEETSLFAVYLLFQHYNKRNFHSFSIMI
jgi:hypothetical protein